MDIPEPTHHTVKGEIGVILPEAPTTSTVPSSTTTTPVQQRDPKDMIVSKNDNFVLYSDIDITEKMVTLIFFPLFQNIYSVLINRERFQLIDEMFSIRQDIRRFNQRVDTFRRNVIHNQMMTEVVKVSGPAPPEDVTKLSLHE